MTVAPAPADLWALLAAGLSGPFGAVVGAVVGARLATRNNRTEEERTEEREWRRRIEGRLESIEWRLAADDPSWPAKVNDSIRALESHVAGIAAVLPLIDSRLSQRPRVEADR